MVTVLRGRPIAIGKFTCEFTFDDEQNHFAVEWAPEIPTKLTPKEIAEYEALRHRFVTEIMRATGVEVMIVDEKP